MFFEVNNPGGTEYTVEVVSASDTAPICFGYASNVVVDELKTADPT